MILAVFGKPETIVSAFSVCGRGHTGIHMEDVCKIWDIAKPGHQCNLSDTETVCQQQNFCLCDLYTGQIQNRRCALVFLKNLDQIIWAQMNSIGNILQSNVLGIIVLDKLFGFFYVLFFFLNLVILEGILHN